MRTVAYIEVPCCSSCESAIIVGEPITRDGRIYCRPCTDSLEKREAAERALLDTARHNAHGAASDEDVLGAARDYAAAYREEHRL